MINIRFLGTFAIGDGTPRARCPGIGGPGRECVAHLFQNPGQYFDRDLLIDRFWSHGSADPRGALNTTLSRLRAALREAGSRLEQCLETDKWGVRLAADPGYDVDCLRLGKATGPDAVDPGVAATETGRLYGGNFLPGCTGVWAVLERERLLSLYVGAMFRACDRLAMAGRYGESLDCCRAILTHDPLRERVHRRAMLLFAAQGDAHLAVRHYDDFRRFLRDACDADPLPETRELAGRLAAHPGAAALEAAMADEFSGSAAR